MRSDTDKLDALFDEISTQVLSVTPPDATPHNTVSAQQTQKPALNHDADKPMYDKLGGIVRLLHDSLRELGYDRSLSALSDVASEISNAQGRLEYVATLTEQAANKVLNAIEMSMPEQEALSNDAQNLEQRWTQLFAGKLNMDAFTLLASDAYHFSKHVAKTSETEKARLLDIMMAQDFQDITGQIIKKIVTITHDVERELAQLLRDHAPPEVKAAQAEKNTQAPQELMNGPAMPSCAMGQDDVDSLLADLGF